jgi:hypothetical protein
MRKDILESISEKNKSGLALKSHASASRFIGAVFMADAAPPKRHH